MGQGQKTTLVLMSIIFLSQLGWTQGEEIFQNITHPRIHELKTLLYISSTYQSVCRDECSYDELNLYYWCITDKGQDYCSPTPDVTYKNEPCRSDHSCDTHGYTYTWCRTDSGWDYCGLTKTIRVFSSSRRQKRQPNNGELICSEINGNKEIRFYAMPSFTNIADGNQWKKEIEEKLISHWSNNCLGSQAKCRFKTDDFRIDQQGQFKRNNKLYINLQIQRNVPRSKGTSTTLAQVIMESNNLIEDNHIQKAFKESLSRRAKITVEVGDIQTPVSNKQRKKCR